MANHETNSANPETGAENPKQQQIIDTLEALITGDNKDGLIRNLQLYREANRGSRVSIFHENIEKSESAMVISGGVHKALKDIVAETETSNKEHSFFTIGFTQGDTMVLQAAATDMSLSDEQKRAFYDQYPDLEAGDSAADFNVLLFYYGGAIQNHLNSTIAKDQRPLVAFGHTHPNVSESYGNFSLPDIVQMADYKEAVRGNRTEDSFDCPHIVLPVNGDFDCMSKEPDGHIRKITDVTAIHPEGDVAVPAYTFKSPDQLTGANYTREADETASDDADYNTAIDQVIADHKWEIS